MRLPSLTPSALTVTWAQKTRLCILRRQWHIFSPANRVLFCRGESVPLRHATRAADRSRGQAGSPFVGSLCRSCVFFYTLCGLGVTSVFLLLYRRKAIVDKFVLGGGSLNELARLKWYCYSDSLCAGTWSTLMTRLDGRLILNLIHVFWIIRGVLMFSKIYKRKVDFPVEITKLSKK